MKIPTRLLLVLAAALVASGCTRHLSRGLADDGSVDQVVFPTADTLTARGGTFPNLENLRQLGLGINRAQLRDLLGPPHYREGVAAREWDYLFNFRDEAGETTQCQFKVVFDHKGRGQTFAWLPASCAQRLARAEDNAHLARRFSLAADVLFAFGRAGVDDILPEGRSRLRLIGTELAQARPAWVEVSGYADRLGEAGANQVLSRARADSVRAVLVEQGVAAGVVRVVGMGETRRAGACDDTLGRDALVACLQPDRRVEIVAAAAP